MSYRFLKGHGTENDFVLLPDYDGSVHGLLEAQRVRSLCDRRAGIGGDGVLRVIRTAALAALAPETPGVADSCADWFMDYRNADGSVAEMCGNGVRVFAHFLFEAGLVSADDPLTVGTRDGDKGVRRLFDGRISVDLGEAQVGGATEVEVAGRRLAATDVRTGNPHAVAFVGQLSEAGELSTSPGFDAERYPDGVNVEFVADRGNHHVAMRVFERGAGETRSCGTGAVAAMVATALRDGISQPPMLDTTYRVDVPGGALAVTWTAGNRMVLTGPAELVAEGTTGL